MDEWLVDRIKYQAGGDFRFQPITEGETGGDWTPELSWFAERFDAERAIRVGNYGMRIEDSLYPQADQTDDGGGPG